MKSRSSIYLGAFDKALFLLNLLSSLDQSLTLFSIDSLSSYSKRPSSQTENFLISNTYLGMLYQIYESGTIVQISALDHQEQYLTP